MEPLVKQFNYDNYQLNTELENIIRRINKLQLRKPDYDSGWFAIGQGATVIKVHNLNTTEVQVELQFKDIDGFGGINNVAYGSYSEGVYWHSLTNTEIKVYRANANLGADEVRIMMWKL